MREVVGDFDVPARSIKTCTEIMKHAGVTAHRHCRKATIESCRHLRKERLWIYILILSAKLGSIVAPGQTELVQCCRVECMRFRAAHGVVFVPVASLSVIRRI